MICMWLSFFCLVRICFFVGVRLLSLAYGVIVGIERPATATVGSHQLQLGDGGHEVLESLFADLGGDEKL